MKGMGFRAHKLLLLLLIMMGVLLHVECKPPSVYDTRRPGAPITLRIRVGETQLVPLPYNFTNYLTIEVPEATPTANNLDSQNKRLCFVNGPGIDMKELAYQPLSSSFRPRDIVVDFNDILMERRTLDLYTKNDLIYVAMSEGLIKVFRLDHSIMHNPFEKVSSMEIEGYNPKQPIESGYFVEVGERLLFISSQLALEVRPHDMAKLEGYTPSDSFESVDYESQLGLLVVAEGTQGMTLYTLNNPAGGNVVLQKLATFTQSQFNRPIDLSDVVAYERQLFVLDRNSGLFRIDLNSSAIAHSAIESAYNLIGKKGCENLRLSNHSLFVSCPQITRIDLKTARSIDYPQSLFHITNIIASGELLVASGSNLVKIYRNDTLVAHYQSFYLDRIVVFREFLVVATELGISYFKWQFYNPQIWCGLSLVGNSNLQGNYRTDIHVWAGCSRQYITQQLHIGYKEELEDMRCLYHFPVEIQLWQGGYIDVLPHLKIGLIVTLCATIILLFLCFVVKHKISALHSAIKRYGPVRKIKNPQYQDFVQEKQQSIVDGRIESAQTEQEMAAPSRDPKSVLEKHDIE